MKNAVDWESIVVEISKNKPNDYASTSGTGFFISKDKIATCYHVLDPGCNGLEKAYWIKSDNWSNWVEAIPILELCHKSPKDIAILQSSFSIEEELPEFKEWSERSSDKNDREFISKGYDPERIKGLGATVFRGSIESLTKKGPQARLQLQTKVGTVRRGHSGSPIWSFEKNAIVGMIDYQAGRVDLSTEMPLAIPIQEIVAIAPKDTSDRILGKIIGNFPSLPPNYIIREEELSYIKRLILSSEVNKTAITGVSKQVGIQGMGGIGKSVLAAAIVLDPEIRQNFPDGIVWISIGREDKSHDNSEQFHLCSKQSLLYQALSDDRIRFETVEEGRIALSKLLSDKNCLIVLDDIWRVDDFEAFNGIGPKISILITTRNSSIIASIGAKECSIDVLEDKAALELLRTWAHQDIAQLPIFKNIIKECGNLPLAISIVGAMARGKDKNYWKIILSKLQNANLSEIRYKIGEYPHHSLLKAIEISLNALEEENIYGLNAAKRYLEFAVFPEDVPIPKNALCLLWKADGLREDQIEDLIGLYVDRSLCRREKNGSLSMHDLQLDYVRNRYTGDLIHLHNRLLKSYQKRYPNSSPLSSDDGYFPQNLAYHLIGAGRKNELKKLSAERRGRFFIVGIGGCGGKITQDFLTRPDSTTKDKLMNLLRYNISEDIKGIWLEADKNDAKNIQRFFGDITKGCYPGYYIPHDIIVANSDVHLRMYEKYGYDIKKQGFVRDAQYLKAIFEIFDTDPELQDIVARTMTEEIEVLDIPPANGSSSIQTPNPIFDSAWKVIKYARGECDGILFILSFGGGTGGGYIYPIIDRIRNEDKADYPVFVLGIMTEPDDFADRAMFSRSGRRSLAAISSIYDLLTQERRADGIILVDNEILFRMFKNDYSAANKFIRQMMGPMVLGRDYPGETPPAEDIARKFSMGLSRSPIFVPFYWSHPTGRNSEEELVKKALEHGRLFNCTPEKADSAIVYCRGIAIDSVKIKKALSTNIGIDEKNILVLRKMGDGNDEILILLGNPYGGDPKAYRRDDSLENKFCVEISLALHHISQNPQDLFYEGNGGSVRLPERSKHALKTFFFGPDGSGNNSGFVFELKEARNRLRNGEKPFFINPLQIFEREREI